MSAASRMRVVALCVSLVAAAPPLPASDLPDPSAGTGVDAKPGVAVPTAVPLTDESGRPVTLADYLGGPPVVLAPVYYTCPNLCGSTLTDLVFALQRLSLTPGRDYQVVAVSIDPREGPSEAAGAKARALAGSTRAELAEASHFLTGAEASAITEAIGFRYRWDDRLQQYAHVSGLALLTPDGRLARWLAGVGLDQAELRLGLIEAGRGAIGGLTDRFLLLCYHYDPASGRYTLLIDRILKIAAALTVLAFAVPAGLALRRERLRRARGEV